MLKHIVLCAALAFTAGAAHAQQATLTASPSPCAGPEYRQMDFWVGDWDLEFDAGKGQVGHATTLVTRNAFGDCVIAEHYSQAAAGYTGASWSIYDSQIGQWRQTWVDTSGSVFVLVGGPVTGKPYAFELKTVDVRGPAKVFKRMIWQDVTPDSLTWRWQALEPDGSWKDEWVLRYHRKA